MTENINGMDMVPPALCGYDLFGMEAEEWQRLMEMLCRSRYEYVILDLSDGVRGLFDILRRSGRIFTVIREDGFAAAKLEQYEAALKKAGCQDVAEKTVKLRLPVFLRLPRDMNHLTAGELAEYAEKVLKSL